MTAIPMSYIDITYIVLFLVIFACAATAMMWMTLNRVTENMQNLETRVKKLENLPDEKDNSTTAPSV